MCEHNRQVWDPGYAVCVDCGAETTVAATSGEPEPEVLVRLTETQRRYLQVAVTENAVDGQLSSLASSILRTLEG